MPFSPQPAIPLKDKISVNYLVKRLQEQVHINLISCAAEDCGDHRYVREAELHRPGLALAGYIKLFTHQRIQVLGNTESKFLENLRKEKQIEAFHNLAEFQVPVIFLTNGNELPQYLLDVAEESRNPYLYDPL